MGNNACKDLGGENEEGVESQLGINDTTLADIKSSVQNTINEHPKPILLTWDWLKEHAYTLSIEEVWNELSNNTMVTVTKDEDNYIKTKGLNSIGDMQSRYTDLGITIVTLSETPRDYHRKLKQKN